VPDARSAASPSRTETTVIQASKQSDEQRAAGPLECWCLHGSVGIASDWRALAKTLASAGISSRAVDLWRFLACCPMPLPAFAQALNADAAGEVFRGHGRALLGYSMGGRMALHALLEKNHPWQAAILISAHPGLTHEAERAQRRAADAEWASRALAGNWLEFLNAWNAQSVLSGGSIRDAATSSRLMQRRREIARSFVDWSLGSQAALAERLGEISVPVLWVVGENDLKFRAIAESACARIPHATLAVAPAAGHRVPWEAGDWLAEHVARFLKLGRL
jgi:2-succinyl-6-hydroxy-2,4-cyclohexadiene-1-carboxylate synthase